MLPETVLTAGPPAAGQTKELQRDSGEDGQQDDGEPEEKGQKEEEQKSIVSEQHRASHGRSTTNQDESESQHAAAVMEDGEQIESPEQMEELLLEVLMGCQAGLEAVIF
jgi:hypothetical protein